jgi:hypothetical protein
MPPHSEIATSFNRFLAGKLSSLSESEISLLADDALTNLVETELSRLSQDEFNRLAEAELSPFVPFVEGVLQELLAEILPPLKPKANAKEEEQTSDPVTFDGILVLSLYFSPLFFFILLLLFYLIAHLASLFFLSLALATISSFVVIKRCVRNLCQVFKFHFIFSHQNIHIHSHTFAGFHNIAYCPFASHNSILDS